MSSHPLTVPQGWTRGRELRVLRQQPPVVVEQLFDMELDPPSAAPVHPDHVGYITFDSVEAAARFIRWWKCPAQCKTLSPHLTDFLSWFEQEIQRCALKGSVQINITTAREILAALQQQRGTP